MQSDKPTLGVIAHNYLREKGLLRMQEDANIVVFADVASSLHRFANHSCPLLSLDIEADEFLDEVRKARHRGILFDGFISFRDWNVEAAAAATYQLDFGGAPPPAPHPSVLHAFRSKSEVRRLINDQLSETLHTPVPFEFVASDISEELFKDRLSSLLQHGPVVLKPDAGSCSYHIFRIDQPDDLPRAWRHFRGAHDYRGGNFIAEKWIEGKEFPVDTVCLEKVERVLVSEYLPRTPGAFFELGIVVPPLLDSVRIEEIETLSKAVHMALGLHHIITHIEVILPPGKPPAIVEINPRLAGDLMQELYRLVYGIDMYRLAARMATNQLIPPGLYGSRGEYAASVIRFCPPDIGRLRLTADPSVYLNGKDDQFTLLFPVGTVLGSGCTNDDRPAYILLAGQDRREIIDRSRQAISSTVAVVPT